MPRKVSTAPSSKLTVVLVPTNGRRFLTIDLRPGAAIRGTKGADFVRVRPAAGVEQSEIDALVGEMRVRFPQTTIIEVLSAPKRQVVAGKPQTREEARPAREVVMEMVEAAHTRDRDALRQLAEETMAEVGL